MKIANKNDLKNEGVDPRRLIKFGNASYVVSLPAGWIRSNGLRKGDLVYLKENSNNELVLQLKTFPKSEPHKILIDLKRKDFRTIRREITSAYTRGYNTIIISGKNIKLSPKQIEYIVKGKVGAELLQLSENEIIIKVSLDEEKISLREMIRRMDSLIRLMMDTLLKQVVEFDSKKLYKEIHDLDEDVNRIFFLVWRMVDYYLLAKRLPNEGEWGLSFSNLSDLKWIVINLEYVGDEIKRISKFVTRVRLKKEQTQNLKVMLTKIKESYEGVMKAFKGDTSDALNFARNKTRLLRECDKVLGESENVILAKITEKMKDIIGYIHYNTKLAIY